LILREKPRDLTGPYENPVRRWVRLREKARQFLEVPPPRKIPVPKPARRKSLQAVSGVPQVDPEVLQRRLNFLLSPAAVEQQLAAPLRPRLTPFDVERDCWKRQMIEIRRIYRAQYLQKLAEVTEVERAKEAEVKRREQEERFRRKEEHLRRIGEDMKRRAILKDRKRIEAKVTEAMQMARRSKIKRQRLFWFRRMESLSKVVVSAENFEEHFGGSNAESESISNSGLLLSRNVSAPFIMRQLGGAKGFPSQKNRRIPLVTNITRELMESSYDLLPEDEPRFEPEPPTAPSPRERAAMLYQGFSEEEKRALVKQKIAMLDEEIKIQQNAGTSTKELEWLRLQLEAAVFSRAEKDQQKEQKKQAMEGRGRTALDGD